MKTIFALILTALAIGLLVWWFAAGHHAWTSTQSLINVTTTDEIFGTSVTTQKWVDDFSPGFLPFSNMAASGNLLYTIVGFLGIGIMAFLCLAIAVWLWISARKQSNSVPAVV